MKADPIFIFHFSIAKSSSGNCFESRDKLSTIFTGENFLQLLK